MGLLDKLSNDLQQKVSDGISYAQEYIDEGLEKAKQSVLQPKQQSESGSDITSKAHEDASTQTVIVEGRPEARESAGKARCPHCDAEIDPQASKDGSPCPYCGLTANPGFTPTEAEADRHDIAPPILSPVKKAPEPDVGSVVGRPGAGAGKKNIVLISACIAALLLISFSFLGAKACSSNQSDSKVAVPQGELIDLHVNVAYESNLIFAKYDVEARIDDSVVGAVSQGGVLAQDAGLEKGRHSIRFFKKGEKKAFAESSFDLEEESYYECSLKAHMSSLDIKGERFETASERDARIEAEKAEKARKEAEEKAAEEEKERKRQAEEEERKKREQEEALKRQQEDEERAKLAAELDGCIGMEAPKAKKQAESIGFKVTFKDESGVDVTDFYSSAKKGSAVRKAKVAKVEIESYGDPRVASLTLGYRMLDPSLLVGKDLMDAGRELDEAGMPFEVIGDYTRDNLTSAYEAGSFDGGGMTVTGASWKDNGKKKVSLEVLSQDQIDESRVKASNRAELESKLGLDVAWGTMDYYGSQLYGSSFKLHYMLGILAEEPLDADTWFLKATCEVNGVSGNCEAKVTGTNDNPRVYDFYVY